MVRLGAMAYSPQLLVFVSTVRSLREVVSTNRSRSKDHKGILRRKLVEQPEVDRSLTQGHSRRRTGQEDLNLETELTKGS